MNNNLEFLEKEQSMIQGEEDVILSTMDGDQQIVQRIQLLGNQLASIHESLINDNDQLVAE